MKADSEVCECKTKCRVRVSSCIAAYVKLLNLLILKLSPAHRKTTIK